MSASTVRELLNALEQTIRDRFNMVNELLASHQPSGNDSELSDRISVLESMLLNQNAQMSEMQATIRSLSTPLRSFKERPELLPTHPMEGLEVTRTVPPAITAESEVKVFIVKPEAPAVVVPVLPVAVKKPEAPEAPAAVKKPEAPEAPAAVKKPEPVVPAKKIATKPLPELLPEPVAPAKKIATKPVPEPVEVEEEVVDDEDADEPDEAEDAGADEAEEAEAVELTAFEYKGITYYRDPEMNVYAEEDGEVSDEPFGIWNEARQRILARK